MKTNRITIALAILLTTQANAGGIPVIDASQIAQTILIVKAHAKDLAQLVEQVKTAKSQLVEAKATLAAMKGGRGMSQLGNMNGVRQALPADFVKTADTIKSLGAAGASANAKAIYKAIKQFGCDEQFTTDAAMRTLCEANAYAAPTTLTLVQDSVQRSQGRAEKLQQILASIDTTDVKAAADLQNRIQLESAMLQNEKIMMDMALQSQQMQQQLVAQQIKERSLKQLTAGDSPTWSFK